MSTKFEIYLATVNTDLMQFVQSDDPTVPISASDYLSMVYGGKKVLACHFVDKDGEDYVLNADDEFIFYADNNFDPYELEGELATAITAGVPITEVVIDTFTPASTAPTYKTGELFLENAADESEIIDYTDWSVSDGVYTFTVSTTPTYSYALNDTANVIDKVMVKAENSAVDIAGDWDDIDRTTGRISIRLNAFTVPCRDKMLANMSASTGRLNIYIGLKRYITGDSTPGQLILDKGFMKFPVGTIEGEPATVTVGSYNSAQVDVLLAAKVDKVINSAKTITDADDTDLDLDDSTVYSGFTVACEMADSTDATKRWQGIICLSYDGTDFYPNVVSESYSQAFSDFNLVLSGLLDGDTMQLRFTSTYGEDINMNYSIIRKYEIA